MFCGVSQQLSRIGKDLSSIIVGTVLAVYDDVPNRYKLTLLFASILRIRLLVNALF